jgi:ABC-2 type transport system permease protein
VLFSMAGVLAAACALQAVIRLRQEEAAGTAELLLAAPVGRVQWLAGYLLLGAGAVVLVIGLAWAGAWAGLTGAGDVAMPADALWETAVAQLPAALIYLSVPALVFVLWPASTTATSWALLGLGVALGIFGGMLGLDQSLRDLSPFTHTPVPHGAATDWSGAWWMLAVSALAAALAVVMMRRREVGSA